MFAEVPGADDGEFSAHGFNTTRVEHEDKIVVPKESAEAVWRFLLSYLVEDTHALRSLDPQFTSHYNVEEFTDTYFDTPALQMLSRRSGVRHRRRTNLTNSEDRKSGRELMQIKLNDVSGNELERAEVKFEIRYPSEFKSKEDGHPMIGMVKPSQRDDFKGRLTAIGIDPYSMRPILTLRDIRKRIYILRAGKPFMSVSHDSARSELMWGRAEFVEIEPELNEIGYTEAGPEARREMTRISEQIRAAMHAQFPELKRDLTPKYNKAFGSLEAQIPFLRLLVRTNMATTGAVSATLAFGLAGLATAVVLVFRRFRRTRPPVEKRFATAQHASSAIGA